MRKWVNGKEYGLKLKFERLAQRRDVLRKHVKAHYGKVTLIRTECAECLEVSIVIDGKTVCCGADPVSEKPNAHERMTRGSTRRFHLTQEQKAEILEAQERKCKYCDCDLDAAWYISKNMKFPKKVKIEFDHVIPHAYAPIHDVSNFVASCDVCNRFKYSHMFEDLERIKAHIRARKWKLGYKYM